jgi:hypothetical protein
MGSLPRIIQYIFQAVVLIRGLSQIAQQALYDDGEEMTCYLTKGIDAMLRLYLVLSVY